MNVPVTPGRYTLYKMITNLEEENRQLKSGVETYQHEVKKLQKTITDIYANAIEVTGDNNDESGWAMFYDKDQPHRKSRGHTHKALLIDIKPIKRGVSKAELSLFIGQDRFADDIHTLLERIRDEGLTGD